MKRAAVPLIAALLFVGLQLRGDAARWHGWIPQQRATFTPGQRVVLTMRSDIPEPVKVTLYEIPVTQVIALGMSGKPLTFDLVAPGKIVKSVLDPAKSARLIPGAIAGYDLENGYEHRIDFGVLRVGRYAAVWDLDGDRGLETVDVTSLGVLAIDEPTRGLTASTFDLRTMRLRSDAALTLYQPGVLRTLRPGADGLVRLDEPHLLRGALVARARDGSLAIATVGQPNTEQRTISEPELEAVETDRPIYRPGQMVFFRAIFRRGDAGSYEAPSGQRAVELRRDGTKIESQSLTLDEFGTVGGSFKLSDDAPLGYYDITAEGRYTGAAFNVEAYRRPEYAIDVDRAPPNVIGGERAPFGVAVRYFFGRPAGGMPVHYVATLGRNTLFEAYRSGALVERHEPIPAPSATATPPIEGTLVADDLGRVSFSVPTKPTENERTLHVRFDARDASGHTVSAESNLLVSPASFYLRIVPRTNFVDEGKAIDLSIAAREYGGVVRPNVDVRLDFAALTYDEARRTWSRSPILDSTRNLRTGEDGVTKTSWQGPAGWYEASATAKDEGGRQVVARQAFWVTAAWLRTNYRFENAGISSQRQTFGPSEPVTLLVTVPRGDVDALIVEGAGSKRRIIPIHLPSNVSTITIPPLPDEAVFYVTLIAPAGTSWISATTGVTVDPPLHRLTVSLTPDRARYEPGSEARFDVAVKDSKGNPARAQVALTAVDDSLYALRRRNPRSLFGRFYAWRYDAAYPNVTWSGLNDPPALIMAGRRLLSIARVNARSTLESFQPSSTADTYLIEPAFENIRKDFRETAFWSPSVVTGPDGHATVTFNWPDSLTSYTADASAITATTDAGEGSASSIVTKDFLVRLETPRFLRLGDSASVIGIAQGRSGARGAALRLAAPELGVADSTSDVRLDAHATGSAAWDVAAKTLGRPVLRLAGASENLRDAMELPLPVERAATIEHVRNAGVAESGTQLSLALPPEYQSGDLRVDLSPSVLGELHQSLQLLQVYPYECTEQAVSSALPAAFLARLSKRFGLAWRDSKTDGIAFQAIARLERLQHQDGSWGWWENDEAHPFMTAYALYGLAELREAGYEVNQWRLNWGRDNLIKQLASENEDTLSFWGGRQTGSQWNTRAFMLFSIARVSSRDTDRRLFAETDAHVEALKPYALAVYGLAHHYAGDDAVARAILSRLQSAKISEGDYVHWEGDSWHYRWEDDPIEATSYALQLLTALEPRSANIPKVVSWLQSQQRGSWWYTTKDTAAAIDAISQTIEPASAELHPRETVRVSVNGRLVKTVRFDSIAPNRDGSFVVPASLLGNGGTLTFEREGAGAFYWSTDWTRYVPAGSRTTRDADVSTLHRLRADTDPALTIERRYEGPRPRIWRLGDLVTVRLKVHVLRDQQYLAVEDAFPAGLEYQPLQYQSGVQWSGTQFLDDRAVFFIARAAAGETIDLVYRLRAMTTGSFTAPAATAYAMYGPPVTAIGSSERMVIIKEKR